MAEPTKTSRLRTLTTLLAATAALYLARDVLIPLTLAALLTFLLAPLAERLERFLGRVAAAAAVIVLTCGTVGGITYVVAGQVTRLAEMLPEYRDNIVSKVTAVRNGAFEKASDAIEQIEEDIQAEEANRKKVEQQAARDDDPTREPAHREAARAGEQEPQKVQVVEPPPSSVRSLAQSFGPMLGPLGTAGMVIVLLLFMLLARRDLRDRIVGLMGQGRIQLTTQAMDEIGSRVSRYLLMQTLINVIHGVAVAACMFLLDVPNFLLWGLLSTVLRYVPYVGPIAAALMPILVSLAVFDGWTQPLMVAGCFVVLELTSNNLLEPWLYGSSAGVSPLAVILTSIFWAWLWGPIGLLLATPLTVCLVVIGKHVPQFRFVNILFGDQPVLEAHARFYQRLLAMDHDEALEIAEHAARNCGALVDVYDTIVVPALALAEIDRQNDQFDERRTQFLHTALREVIDELAELAEREPAADTPSLATPMPALPPDRTVLVMPARDEGDELVGVMLAHCVTASGGRAEAVSMAARTSGMVDVLQQHAPDLVCISAVPPSAVAHARHVYKRIVARFPGLPIVLGLWQSQRPAGEARMRIGSDAATPVVRTLREAMVELDRLARSAGGPPRATPAPTPAGVPAQTTR